MCLWCMRMVSIYKDAQGNPGSDESFSKGLTETGLNHSSNRDDDGHRTWYDKCMGTQNRRILFLDGHRTQY